MRHSASQNMLDAELTFDRYRSDRTNSRTPKSDCFLSFGGLDEHKSHGTKKKSLILSLEKTLLITQENPPEYPYIGVLLEIMGFESIVYVTKRPGLKEFLTRLRKLYNIHIFTTSKRAYAEALLDALHLKHYFISIFGREDCKLAQGPVLLKDLTKVNEPLEHIVLIDNSSLDTSHYRANSLKISTFAGDMNDNELSKLVPFLEKLAQVADVRSVSSKMVAFHAGSDINTPTFKDKRQKPKNSPKAIINKFLENFFPNSELDEKAGYRNRDRIKTMYSKPKYPSTPLKLASLRSIDVLGERSPQTRGSLTQRETQRDSPTSTRASGIISEEQRIEFLRSARRLTYNCDEEGNYSLLMDETAGGQRRKNFLVPSLPMRTKPMRTLLF